MPFIGVIFAPFITHYGAYLAVDIAIGAPTNQRKPMVVKQKNTPSTTQKNCPREISDTNFLKKKQAKEKTHYNTLQAPKSWGGDFFQLKAPTKNKKNADALSPLENSGRHGRNPSIGRMVKEPKRVPPWRNSVTTRRFIEKKTVEER